MTEWTIVDSQISLRLDKESLFIALGYKEMTFLIHVLNKDEYVFLRQTCSRYNGGKE